MLTVIEGRLGSGTTAIMAKLVKENAEKTSRKIYAIAPFSFPCEKLTSDDFIAKLYDDKLYNCIIALDHTYALFDSRMSQTKVNRLFSYFVTQSRKRDCDIYIAVNDFNNIDSRLRRMTRIGIKCSLAKKTIITEIMDLESAEVFSSNVKIADVVGLCTEDADYIGEESSLLGLKESLNLK